LTAKSVIQTDNVKKPFDIAKMSRLFFANGSFQTVDKSI